jgi:hypothetical protein
MANSVFNWTLSESIPSPCWTESSVNFVQFVWDNVEQFSCTRHSFTLLPLTTIIALVHKRSNSLMTVVRATGGVIRTVVLCAGPSSWRSYVPHLLLQRPLKILSMLRLQTSTPSLAASRKLHVPIHLQPGNVWIASRDYIWSLLVRRQANRFSTRRLIPPEYPSICIMYGSDKPDHRRHRHSRWDVSLQGALTNTFSSNIKAIKTLVEFKEPLWCDFCLKPLFFPPACRKHQLTVFPCVLDEFLNLFKC